MVNTFWKNLQPSFAGEKKTEATDSYEAFTRLHDDTFQKCSLNIRYELSCGMPFLSHIQLNNNEMECTKGNICVLNSRAFK
jgi:hypothetical protein